MSGLTGWLAGLTTRAWDRGSAYEAKSQTQDPPSKIED